MVEQGNVAAGGGRVALTTTGPTLGIGSGYTGIDLQTNFLSVSGVTVQNFGTDLTVVSSNKTAQTTTQTITYTPASAAGSYELYIYVQVTTAGTSTIPKIAYTDEGGAAVAATAIPMINLGGTAFVVSIIATGRWNGSYMFDTDASGSAITITITPTGSTFNYDVILLRAR